MPRTSRDTTPCTSPSPMSPPVETPAVGTVHSMNSGSTALRRRAAVRFQTNTALSRRCRSMRGDPKQRNSTSGLTLQANMSGVTESPDGCPSCACSNRRPRAWRVPRLINASAKQMKAETRCCFFASARTATSASTKSFQVNSPQADRCV